MSRSFSAQLPWVKLRCLCVWRFFFFFPQRPLLVWSAFWKSSLLDWDVYLFPQSFLDNGDLKKEKKEQQKWPPRFVSAPGSFSHDLRCLQPWWSCPLDPSFCRVFVKWAWKLHIKVDIPEKTTKKTRVISMLLSWTMDPQLFPDSIAAGRWVKGSWWSSWLFSAQKIYDILLMVQKSQGQPPFGCIKPM